MKSWVVNRNLLFKLTKYKVFDSQFIWDKNYADWFSFELRTRTHQDHPGIYFTIELFRRLYFNLSIYDVRHWDYEHDEFEIYK